METEVDVVYQGLVDQISEIQEENRELREENDGLVDVIRIKDRELWKKNQPVK